MVGREVLTAQPSAVYEVLGSSLRGLSEEEVGGRLARDGANELPPPPRRSWLRWFAAQFTDLFAVVLLVASAITFLAYLLQQPRDVGTLQLAVAILGVVVLNAVIGFAQEYSAERTAEALQAMVPHTCRVLRDGERRRGAGRATSCPAIVDGARGRRRGAGRRAGWSRRTTCA